MSAEHPVTSAQIAGEAAVPEPTLKKNEVGLIVGISTTLGLVVGQEVLVALNVGFGTMGPAFILAMFVALVLAYIQVMSFSELATMFPTAGSIFDYVREGLGVALGTVAALLGYVLVAIFSVSGENQLGGTIITVVWTDAIDWWVWSLIISAALLAINCLGVKWYGVFDVTITTILLLGALALGLLGLSGIGASSKAIASGLPASHFTTISAFASMVALSFFMYIGYEYVCPLGEEIRNPTRNLPLSMFIGLTGVFIIMALLGLAETRWVPGDTLSGTPTSYVNFADALFGGSGKTIMGIVALFATISSLDSAYVAAPRILYGMGVEGHLPRAFAYIHPRFRTPWVATGFIALCTISTFPFGGGSRTLLILILSSVVGWMISYALIHASVISLRIRRKDLVRPFSTPFYPVPQIVGLVGLAYLLTQISPSHSLTGDVYLYSGALIVLSIVYAFVWDYYRKRRAA